MNIILDIEYGDMFCIYGVEITLDNAYTVNSAIYSNTLYVCFDFRVKNNTKDVINVGSNFFTGSYDGYVSDQSILGAFILSNYTSIDCELPSGKSTKGTILFEAPSNFKNFEVQAELFTNTDPVVFSVAKG